KFNHIEYMLHVFILLFFFSDQATTEIYTLSLHDALPIWREPGGRAAGLGQAGVRFDDQRVLRPNGMQYDGVFVCAAVCATTRRRSEEHTSELQSRENLVCRLLLEKKKKKKKKVDI